MDVYKDIDSALEAVGLPYYHGMPEFSVDDEPNAYISYTLIEKPAYYASGKARALSVWAAVSVFTAEADAELYRKTAKILAANGYEYQSGTDLGAITPYPCKKHYVMDFIRNYYGNL